MESPLGLRRRTVGPAYWVGLWIVDFVSVLHYAVSALSWWRRQADVRILVYHDVIDTTPRDDPYRLSVPPALFEQHIRFLRDRGYRFLSVEEAASALASRQVPDRAVVITFDDGYASLADVVARVLDRYAVPATLFVAVGHIGQATFPWNGPDSRFTRPLDWDELAELVKKDRLEIGSHTLTHRHVHGLARPDQDAELGQSRQILQSRIGREVRVFAYPFGGWGTFPEALHGRLRSHGYRAACTNVMGSNVGAPALALRRVRIGWDDTLWRFRLKLAGAYDWSDTARRILASLRALTRAKITALGKMI